MTFYSLCMKPRECGFCGYNGKDIDIKYEELKKTEDTKFQTIEHHMKSTILPGISSKIISHIERKYPKNYSELSEYEKELFYNDYVQCINIGRVCGVYYCNECSSVCKTDIIEHLNDTCVIPLYFALYEKKSISRNTTINLSFYRESQNKIYEGTTSFYDNKWMFGIQKIKEKNMFVINLFFEENGKSFSKYVSVENICFHNPWFYDKVVNSKNLFMDKNMIISFDDLSNDIKDYFLNMKESFKDKKSEDFPH